MKDALHPLSFGVAMLVAFLHWMISPPDRSAWALVFHLGLDVAVGASMGVVAALCSRGGSRLAYFVGKVPTDLRSAWLRVHHEVRERELSHVVLSRVAAFVAACVAFELGGSGDWDPRATLAALIAGFVGAQAGVLVAMRPRAGKFLEQALIAQQAQLPAGRFDALRGLFIAEAER